jgi:flagellin-like hook-associated protein FlgL
MRINHNIQALNAYSKLSKNQFATGKALEKLSSGLRINRASDDAAGLAISEKMRGQIRGLQQAEKNAMDGISLIQTAEGALAEVHDMLSRMRELAVQGANGTLTESDRKVIQDEIDQLREQIDRVGNDTQFNTKKLLNGSLSENADIRSLYGTVDYSRKGTGLRDIAVDSASVLPQDVYSLNVVTKSKVVSTNVVNGTDDPYKTGLENILLSPDSLLEEGDYKIALKSSLKFTDAKYENATDLDASDVDVANGKYTIEYDKTKKEVQWYSVDENGSKMPMASVTLTSPTTPQSVTLTAGSKSVSFMLTDPAKDAKITFEKNISYSGPAPTVFGTNVSEIDTTGSQIPDGKYTVKYDKTTRVATLLDSENKTVATSAALPASGSGVANFGNGIKVKIDDTTKDIGLTSFEKLGALPGKQVANPPASTLTPTPSTGTAAVPGGSYTVEYTITNPNAAGFTPSLASTTYSQSDTTKQPKFANGKISIYDTTLAGTSEWTLTKKTATTYELTDASSTVIDTVTVGVPFHDHGLDFTITSDAGAAVNDTVKFTPDGTGTSISTEGGGVTPAGAGAVTLPTFDGNPAISIGTDAPAGTWKIKYVSDTEYTVIGPGVNDKYTPGTEYNNHGITFKMTSGVATNLNSIDFTVTAPSTATAVLKDANGKVIDSQSVSLPATSTTFSNGLKIDGLGNKSVTEQVNVAMPAVSNVDISKSALEDGDYMIKSDGITAYLYKIDANGKPGKQPLDTILNVTAGTNTFGAKNITFTGQAGTIIFKQSTEYELDIYKANADLKNPNEVLAKKTSVHFGDEAIDFRDSTGKSYGITVDFTNAATGYVKRGGSLPDPVPYFDFGVQQLSRTSVILKDSTQKVIAHQFVDNDRKFIELKGTGITFGTGVLSDGEVAQNIDVRRNLENASVTFQIGTNAGEIVALGIGDIRTKALGIDKFKLTDETSASNAIALIDSAIDKVSEVRSKLGAYQNRMEHTVNNITQSNENLTAAESRIRDADMAREMTEFTKYNIINQSATAMLAQANQLPQGILQLLKG